MPMSLLAYFVIVLVSALILVPPVTAQDDQHTTWTIEERCLNAPAIPDENWEFDGEILMRGWGGIHAINSDYDTPYIVNWGNGVLSPDGQWVLSQDVEYEVEQLSGPGPLGRYHISYDDIVARNLDTQEVVRFDWYAYVTYTSRPYLAGPAELRWLDDKHFAAFYGGRGEELRFKIGDVTTGTVTDWTNRRFEDYELSISPDQTRIHYYSQLYSLPDNILLHEAVVGTNYDFMPAVWSPDSSLFVDILTELETRTRTLAIFDREGSLTAIPFSVQNGGFTLLGWSPASDYFAFSASGEVEGTALAGVFLLDIRAAVIYDLCLDAAQGWAWSPDGTQFVTLPGRDQQPIIITDMTTWRSVIAGYHSGYVLMWRTDR